MKKYLTIIAIITAAVILSTGSAFPWAKQMMGKPNIIPGKDKGVFFWVDDEGYHVRVANPEKDSKFWGVIDTQYKAIITNRMDVQSGDELKMKGGKQIQFTFYTKGDQIKGFDFKTNSRHLAFTMLLNNKRVAMIDFRAGKDKTPFQHTPFKVFDIEPEKHEGGVPLADPRFR